MPLSQITKKENNMFYLKYEIKKDETYEIFVREETHLSKILDKELVSCPSFSSYPPREIVLPISLHFFNKPP